MSIGDYDYDYNLLSQILEIDWSQEHFGSVQSQEYLNGTPMHTTICRPLTDQNQNLECGIQPQQYLNGPTAIHLYELFNQLEQKLEEFKADPEKKIEIYLIRDAPPNTKVCYSYEEKKNKIRPNPKNTQKGAGGEISASKLREEIWKAEFSLKNAIWCKNKHEQMNEREPFASMEEFCKIWHQKPFDFTAEQMQRELQGYHDLTSSEVGNKRSSSGILPQETSKPVRKKQRLEDKAVVGKVGNTNAYPVEEITWGVGCKGVLSLFCKRGKELLLVCKEKKSPFKNKGSTIINESGESPREVIVTTDEMRFFTTNEGAYRLNGALRANSPPIFSQISEQTGRFWGLDGNPYILFFSVDKTITMVNIFPEMKETAIFNGECALRDLAFFPGPSNEILLFALDDCGQISMFILNFGPFRVSVPFILEARNNEGEKLVLDGPLGLTIQPEGQGGIPVHLLAADTKNQRIVKILLDCELLRKHKEGSFACEFEVVWKSQDYFPISLYATSTEIYFSATSNLATLVIEQERQSIEVPVSDTDNSSPMDTLDSNSKQNSLSGNSNRKTETHSTESRNKPSGNSRMASEKGRKGDDSPSDSGGRDEDEGDSNDISMVKINSKLYENILKMIAQMLNHPKGAPLQKNVVRKLSQLFKQIPVLKRHSTHWGTLITFWGHIFDDQVHCLKDNIELTMAGELVNSTAKEVTIPREVTPSEVIDERGRVVKVNWETGEIFTSLSGPISEKEFFRPLSNPNPWVVYSGTGKLELKSCLGVAVWGEALVRTTFAFKDNLNTEITYYVVADPSSEKGICKLVPDYECFFSVDPRLVVGVYHPSSGGENALVDGDTMLVFTTLPLLPGAQINTFLSAIRYEAIHFPQKSNTQNIDEITEIMKNLELEKLSNQLEELEDKRNKFKQEREELQQQIQQINLKKSEMEFQQKKQEIIQKAFEGRIQRKKIEIDQLEKLIETLESQVKELGIKIANLEAEIREMEDKPKFQNIERLGVLGELMRSNLLIPIPGYKNHLEQARREAHSNLLQHQLREEQATQKVNLLKQQQGDLKAQIAYHMNSLKGVTEEIGMFAEEIRSSMATIQGLSGTLRSFYESSLSRVFEQSQQKLHSAWEAEQNVQHEECIQEEWWKKVENAKQEVQKAKLYLQIKMKERDQATLELVQYQKAEKQTIQDENVKLKNYQSAFQSEQHARSEYQQARNGIAAIAWPIFRTVRDAQIIERLSAATTLKAEAESQYDTAKRQTYLAYQKTQKATFEMDIAKKAVFEAQHKLSQSETKLKQILQTFELQAETGTMQAHKNENMGVSMQHQFVEQILKKSIQQKETLDHIRETFAKANHLQTQQRAKEEEKNQINLQIKELEDSYKVVQSNYKTAERESILANAELKKCEESLYMLSMIESSLETNAAIFNKNEELRMAKENVKTIAWQLHEKLDERKKKRTELEILEEDLATHNRLLLLQNKSALTLEAQLFTWVVEASKKDKEIKAVERQISTTPYSFIDAHLAFFLKHKESSK